MTQQERYFPLKPRDLRSTIGTHAKKPDVIAQICIPSLPVANGKQRQEFPGSLWASYLGGAEQSKSNERNPAAK